jgi:biotin carboxyl carrier protein
MAYISTVHEHNYSILTTEDDAQKQVTLDGTSYMLDWQHIATLGADTQRQVQDGGHYSLLIAGRSYDIFARRINTLPQQDGQSYEILFAGQRFEVTVEDERSRLLAGLTRSTVASNAARVQAPMPGLVANVCVEVGQTISAGQTVVVLEAMKMENDLPAPIAGTITEIKVSTGQTVDQGQVLIVITAEQ